MYIDTLIVVMTSCCVLMFKLILSIILIAVVNLILDSKYVKR